MLWVVKIGVFSQRYTLSNISNIDAIKLRGIKMKKILTVDIGASSGRVMLGVYNNGYITLDEIHRFNNGLKMIQGQTCWDVDFLLEQVVTGIEQALDAGHDIDSIGIDTWGVDFVLIDKDGNRLGEAVSYRDARTNDVYDLLIKKLSKEFIYAKTGIQFLPFNTLFQLAALNKQQPEWIQKVDKLLFIPDYLNFKLTGVRHCEYTNATTSQLVDCQTKQWDPDLLQSVGASKHWFIEPTLPNRLIGSYLSKNNHQVPVASIASHDTASAILALPCNENNVVYISSGTWSLIGIESDKAINNQLAQSLNITNEGGAESRFRVLKNIMGLWLIQKVQKENQHFSFAELVSLAEQAKPFSCLIDPDHISFLNPISMIDAIQKFCSETHQYVPKTEGEIARCIFESLAFQYRRIWLELCELKGEVIDNIHIIGGGIQNKLLNQLCADACGLPVTTGPIEASAIGNLCGQLIALDELESVREAREVVARSFPIERYTPNKTNVFLDKWLEFERVSQF